MSDVINQWKPATNRLEVAIGADEYNALTEKVEALEKENKRIAKRCQAIAQQHYLAKNAAVDIDEKITKEFNL